jgi:uncharacterized PurR-regulated membrane protein YhhQ (DUF165 family)
MSSLSAERRKIVILATLPAVLTMPAILTSQHLRGLPLRVFVIGYALAMATLLAYVITQLVKLKRYNRTAQRSKA